MTTSRRSNFAWDHGLFRGDRFELAWTVRNPSTGGAVDTSGWGLVLDIHRSENSDDVVAEVAGVGGAEEVVVAVAPGDVEDLSRGKYFYRLRRTDAGSEGTLAFGDLPLW